MEAQQKLVLTTKLYSAHIELDNETNILLLKGHSIPDQAQQFFAPIFAWVDCYLKSNPSKTTLIVAFEYLHTGAARQLYELIKMLHKSEENGNKLIVNWCYEKDDDDIKDLGKEFSDVLGIDFCFSEF